VEVGQIDRSPRLHAIQFQPIVQIGENLHLMPVNKYFTVEFIEGIPMIDKDFGAISAGDTKKDQELTFLYMPRNELAQWRFVPIDNVQVTRFVQPRNPKWITRDTSGKLIRALDYANPIVETLQLTEFFQFEETKAFIDIYAPSAVSTSVIRFYGYRYMLREIPKPPIFTTVWYEARAPIG